MSENLIEKKIDKHIAVISLNRPDKRNAMNAEMIQQLITALESVNKDKAVQVVVVRGNGTQFCAGADIRWMKETATSSYEKNYDDAQLLADLMYRLYTLDKPTIVLVHGAVMGGGLGLVSAADIAIGSDDAYFALSEVRIGITPSTISPYVINAIGERAAHYYFLTAGKFDAAEAYRIGLLHRMTNADALEKEGMELAASLAELPPHALKAAKQLIRHVAKEKISETLGQKTAEHLANLRSAPETQACLQDFIENKLGK